MLIFNSSSRPKLFSSRTIPSVNLCKIITMNMLLVLTNVNMLSGLKCVCNPKDCDLIRQNDCPGKGLTVWDPCKCCKICAKIEGETCGGPGGFSGTCEPPLKCISKPPVVGTGICLDLPSISTYDGSDSHREMKLRNCLEPVKIDPGCEIVDRKCECWHQPIVVCKENFARWDFANVQECELNLANLYKSEVEFDEDYTLPPFDLSKAIKKRKKKQNQKEKHNQLDFNQHNQLPQ